MPGVELEHVGRDARRHVDHPAEPATPLLLDVDTDELEDVELALPRWRKFFVRSFERGAESKWSAGLPGRCLRAHAGSWHQRKLLSLA